MVDVNGGPEAVGCVLVGVVNEAHVGEAIQVVAVEGFGAVYVPGLGTRGSDDVAEEFGKGSKFTCGRVEGAELFVRARGFDEGGRRAR